MTDSTPDLVLGRLSGRIAFTVGDAAYTWTDVALTAVGGGEWGRLELLCHHGIAAGLRARAAGERLPRRRVERAAERFRYLHGLTIASAMHAWLRDWDLTAESWTGSIRRQLLRARHPAAAADPEDPARVAKVIRADGACSGILREFARHLAARAVAQARVGEAAGLQRTSRPEGEAFRSRAAAAHGLGPPAEIGRRAAHLALLEDSYARFAAQVATPAAVERQIDARKSAWVLIEGTAADFPTLAAAREAALCVTEDGELFEEVASRSGSPACVVRFFVEDADPAAAAQLLAAPTGGLAGPLPWHGKYRLLRLARKVVPSATDPALVARATDILVRREIDRELAARVRWHPPAGP